MKRPGQARPPSKAQRTGPPRSAGTGVPRRRGHGVLGKEAQDGKHGEQHEGPGQEPESQPRGAAGILSLRLAAHGVPGALGHHDRSHRAQDCNRHASSASLTDVRAWREMRTELQPLKSLGAERDLELHGYIGPEPARLATAPGIAQRLDQRGFETTRRRSAEQGHSEHEFSDPRRAFCTKVVFGPLATI